MSVGELTVRVALFCLIPLALTGILWVLSRIAVRRGWLVKRREPTELELAQDRLRVEIEAAQAAILAPLVPIMRRYFTALYAIMPPPRPTLRERLRRWFR